MRPYLLIFWILIAACLFCKPDRQKILQPVERSFLNQHTLQKWVKTNFSGSGPVNISDSVIIIGAGNGLTGVTWTGGLPKKNYEISLQAMRVQGDDFFCGLTFPVRGTYCSLIVGGWGGGVVGISNVDWTDASENITTLNMTFRDNVWHLVRLKVTDEKILAWIDNSLVIDLPYLNRQLSLHPFMEPAVPFGLATWKTKARIRNILLKENVN